MVMAQSEMSSWHMFTETSLVGPTQCCNNTMTKAHVPRYLIILLVSS